MFLPPMEAELGWSRVQITGAFSLGLLSSALAALPVGGNFTTNSVTVHLIPFLTPRGYSPALAASMIGWMGAMQLPARIVFAPLTRLFGHTTMTALIFFGQAAALIQLAFAANLSTLAPMVVILGAANGMSTLARATTIAELFGPRDYGAISGAVALGANGVVTGQISLPS